jgi:predicted amidohydrolase
MKGVLVAAVQMRTTNNKLLNLQRTYQYVEQVAAERKRRPANDIGSTFVCLPECCAFTGSSGAETISAAESIELDAAKQYPTARCLVDFKQADPSVDYDGVGYINYVAGLCEIAHLFSVWISVGGFPERRTPPTHPTPPTPPTPPTSSTPPAPPTPPTPHTDGLASSEKNGNRPGNSESAGSAGSAEVTGIPELICNTHFLISPEGKIASRLYRKMHLFDAPVVGMRESLTTGTHKHTHTRTQTRKHTQCDMRYVPMLYAICDMRPPALCDMLPPYAI